MPKNFKVPFYRKADISKATCICLSIRWKWNKAGRAQKVITQEWVSDLIRPNFPFSLQGAAPLGHFWLWDPLLAESLNSKHSAQKTLLQSNLSCAIHVLQLGVSSFALPKVFGGLGEAHPFPGPDPGTSPADANILLSDISKGGVLGHPSHLQWLQNSCQVWDSREASSTEQHRTLSWWAITSPKRKLREMSIGQLPISYFSLQYQKQKYMCRKQEFCTK